MIRIATSFSPSRIARQKHCLNTWVNAGCEVIAVQSPGESALLQQHFDGVQFTETDLVGDAFGRSKLVRIKTLTDLAKESPVLILNSDIEIELNRSVFNAKWGAPQSKILKVGVRWQRGRLRLSRKVFKWGIDAFMITPEISEIVPDIGMTMGCPVWDYWLIWYMHTHGFQVKTDLERGFWHENHDQNWSREEYNIGFEIVKKEYGISEKFLTSFVQDITRRKHLKR